MHITVPSNPKINPPLLNGHTDAEKELEIWAGGIWSFKPNIYSSDRIAVIGMVWEPDLTTQNGILIELQNRTSLIIRDETNNPIDYIVNFFGNESILCWLVPKYPTEEINWYNLMTEQKNYTIKYYLLTSFEVYIDLKPVAIFDNTIAIPMQMRTYGFLKMGVAYNVTVNVSYKGNITLQAAFPGERPFNSVPSLSIFKNLFTLDYINVYGGDWNKTICYLPIILNGSAEETVEIATNVTVIIRDSSGEEIKTNIHLSGSLQFIRGDANGDGKVNIADAMFIAQYLAGNRPLSQLNPLNAASVKHDSGGKDTITIADAMFIAQYLAGLRNSLFELEE